MDILDGWLDQKNVCCVWNYRNSGQHNITEEKEKNMKKVKHFVRETDTEGDSERLVSGKGESEQVVGKREGESEVERFEDDEEDDDGDDERTDAV